MLAMDNYVERLREILAELDALAEALDGGEAEALEELNAEFEDALMLFDELGGEDAREELDDALEELGALAGDYRALAKRIDGAGPLAERLEMATQMGRNLEL
ncbi:MAG: hypothetical protein Q4C10_06215 [Clostridia bacterium]|nr:hypothetical protein [Clostridia bacterium]